MTYKILKSILPTEEHVDSFQRLCNTQIEEMRKHDAHMKMVKKDPKNYHPYPAPGANEIIMAAIVKDGDDYNIEFEVEDDVTPPPPTLEEKKTALANKVGDAAKEIQRSFFPPPLKQRLHGFELVKAQQAIEYDREGNVVKDDRTPAQKKLMIDHKVTFEKVSKIDAIVAQAESEIHDLTEKTIDKWQVPNLSEVK